MEPTKKIEIILEGSCKLAQRDGVLTIIDTMDEETPSQNIRKYLRSRISLEDKK